MAFLAPQRQQAQRPHHVHPLLDTSIQQTPQDTQPAREWVLFSSHASSGAETATISTAHTARTPGRSALSELDSLRTRPSRHAEEDHGIDEDDETDDLDSLDDGLHAFAVPGRPLHDSDTVLPVHDGLGTFAVQEQLWQHERYNPNRRRRPSAARRSSSQQMRRSNNVAAIVEEDSNREAEQETWRMKRIEDWRMEQSRAILEEIEKETRRLRRNTTSRSEMTNERNTTFQEPAPSYTQSIPAHSSAPADEGFWAHFTRRVIQDLIGIDDATLCYIFGENLAGEDDTPLSSTPRQSDILASPPQRNVLELARTGSTWEERLIARIARELGILVGQLTEHPGAFSTYQEMEEEHISYAGLNTAPAPRQQASSSSILPPSMRGTTLPSNSCPFSPDFEPTMRAQGNVDSASHWGVEDSSFPTTSTSHQHDPNREHWERDLDVRAVFNFIRDRLLRRRAASPSAHRPSTAQAQSYTTSTQPPHRTASTATTSPTNASRAALIRAHHPLISSPRASTHRRPLSPIVSVPQALGSVLGRRVLSESSCASQSSKRTRTSASVSRSTNYWDWAGPDGVAGWGEA